MARERRSKRVPERFKAISQGKGNRSSGRTEEILRLDREHIIHPLCPVGQNAGIVFERSYDRVMLRDTEGREYIDAGSQYANVNLGYGRIEILEAAMEQARTLQFTGLYYGYTNPATVECARRLADLTPEGLDHFIFCSGGSEANETAMKMARVYWRQKGQNKYKIIGLYHSYHGSTYGALSVTGLGGGRYQQGADPMLPGILHIPSYYCYRCAFGHQYPGCGLRCAQFLADTIQSEGPGTVAAFMAEPVQGAGGIIQPPPEYWPTIRKICTEYEVLLIGDEVMTGFARTGKMFALEHWDVAPDIMTIAKGITSGYFPFGATVLSRLVTDSFKDALFVHGLTYSGHPTCAAAAVKTMEIYRREGVAEHAAEVGRYALERLKKEFLPLSHVGTVNGLGLFLGLEIVADKATKSIPAPEVMLRLQKEFRENGVWIRFGHNRFQIAPPLVITRKQMDRVLDVMKAGIGSLK